MHGRGHDIVVVGASAGGIEALKELLQGVPEDLPAAIFVVLHIGIRSHLSHILSKSCALPVVTARSGADIASGTVSVAGPDRHMLLHDAHILLSRGPRENMSRPAVDPLFRSAAATYGGRVIGIVLSGSLNDGTAGLKAIKRCGGMAVVQAPSDASHTGMPSSALAHVDVDHIGPAVDLGRMLGRLTREPAGATPSIPFDIRLESAIAAQEVRGMRPGQMQGQLSPFTCPECQGALWEAADAAPLRYRCHAGHAFSAESLMEARRTEVDTLLEKLLRSHQERAALARRMAEEESRNNRTALADQLERRAREYESDAELVRRLARRGPSQTSEKSMKEDGGYLDDEGVKEE